MTDRYQMRRVGVDRWRAFDSLNRYFVGPVIVASYDGVRIHPTDIEEPMPNENPRPTREDILAQENTPVENTVTLQDAFRAASAAVELAQKAYGVNVNGPISWLILGRDAIEDDL